MFQLRIVPAYTLACVFASSVSFNPLVYGQDKVNFARDVRPILSDRCFFCHGPDSQRREADLRLDLAETAYELAIAPGEPEDSELIARIFSDDPDLVMPPPASKLELTPAERDTLKRWIAQGAEYDEHWAFQSVERPVLPEQQLGASTHPIDRLVGKTLAKHGLKPSAPADRVTLIRRLSFDLTGIPPSIEEVEAFLADDEEGAYERLVDRLLESERFGERMAVDWLDAARYADTYGYQNDRYRPMWPWRDWVVQAFNGNLGYDDFITWQIAGDLLPEATTDQILATAFNRNHRQTNEGGSVEEEFRAEYVADRVNTFGAAFLGLTLECCRCHDHKYDPVTQREYYQLAAFFNSIDESGLYPHFNEAVPTPTLWLTEKQQADALAALKKEIGTQQARLDHWPVDEALFHRWRAALADVRPPPVSNSKDEIPVAKEPKALRELLETSLQAAMIGHFPFEEIDQKRVANQVDAQSPGKTGDSPIVETGKVGNGLRLSGENKVTTAVGGDFSRNQPFTFSLWVETPTEFRRAVLFHRSRAWTDSGSRGYELLIEDGRLSAALVHFWPGNAIRVVTQEKLPLNRWTHVSMVYDGSSRADGLRIFVDGEPQAVDVVRDKLTKHIKGADGFGGGDASEVTLGQRFRDVGFKNGRVDEFKIFDRDLSALELKYLYLADAFPANVAEVLHNVSDGLLEEYYATQDRQRDGVRAELRKLRDEASQVGDGIAEIMVMRELPEPRPTYVLLRGAYDAPGDPVTRGTPAKILPRQWQATPSRLELAQWLVDPEHPLTARVAVNRFWQMLFGRGLVSTAEDFGLQGDLPSHPELLDWLAYDFMHHDWDVKRLLKSIIMSETYRQQSNPTPERLQIDPENALLGRGPAVRLPAEMIRDAALAASGLLVEQLGGPPAKPYQPAGLWKEKSGKVYKRDEGAGSHRRSLYTYWKRTSPPPAMMTLDASNREVCVVRRQVTMTPLQMLVLLNDPQYVEAARSLAARAMRHSKDLEGQLQFVFQSMVTRKARDREIQVLRELAIEQRQYFSQSPEQAQELLAVGDQPLDDSLDLVSLAALTVVAEGLMSYDETVMKR